MTIGATNLELTSGLITGIVLGASVLGFVLYKAHAIYMKLETGEKDRVEKAGKEEAAIREQLLQRYKELDELREREMSGLRLHVESLANEVRQLRDTVVALRRENEELRTLNLTLQTEVRRNTRDIQADHHT